jgi:hypothetical protein
VRGWKNVWREEQNKERAMVLWLIWLILNRVLY